MDKGDRGTPAKAGAAGGGGAGGAGIDVRRIELPAGGGAISGIGARFQAAEFTGTATLSVPVPLTACRSAAPELTLDYGSTAGQGAFGLGWSLPLPSIRLRTSNRIPRYDGTDTVEDWRGKALIPVHDSIGERVVDGRTYLVERFIPELVEDFTRIERWRPADGGAPFWRTIDTGDTIRFFGRTEAARIADPAAPTHVAAWLLEEEYHPDGDATLYAYRAEDDAGIGDGVWEQGRSQCANRYLTAVRYGNALPLVPAADGGTAAAPGVTWHFQLVVDYGDYSPLPSNDTPYRPTGPWAARPDPFSRYDTGFEVRTHRLCRNLLMFHLFAAELGDEPVLVRRMALDYDLDPGGSMLTRVTSTGWRHDPGAPSGARYVTAALPPLDLGYVPFEPGAGTFEIVLDGTGQSPTGMDRPPNYHLVDLDGDGVPGILYADGESVRYWAPVVDATGQGPVRYAERRPVTSFPPDRAVDGSGQVLTDLDGDGRMALVERRPTYGGFYRRTPAGEWDRFRPFARLPTDFFLPGTETADLDGDGRGDLVRIGDRVLAWRPGEGGEGYGEEALRGAPPGLPTLTSATSGEAVLFADVLGAGTPQRVRIASGCVECWPSLGYGMFGAKVTLGGAPAFPAGFDAGRIALADIDGSGAADLVLIHADHVAIHRNLSGNAFAAEPLRVELPAAAGSPAQVRFADLDGRGAQCLVFHDLSGGGRYWRYDFTGGRTPALLSRVDNNSGAVTAIGYESSARFALRAAAAGRPWVTRLPFPVQLVETIEETDQLSGSREAETVAYRDGYFDLYQRRLRGFALVERTDTWIPGPERGSLASAVTRLRVADPDPAAPPPALVRNWYDVGAFDLAAALDAERRSERFHGDPQAPALGGSVADWGGDTPSADELRQSRAALAGRPLRREIYGLDGSDHEDVPFVVEEWSYTVRREQAAMLPAEGRAAFFVGEREHLSAAYERDAADPRVSHDLTFAYDDTGRPLRGCAVAYRRRGVPPGSDDPQGRTWVLASEEAWLPARDEPDLWLAGLPWQERRFDLPDPPPPTGPGGIYDWAALKAAVDQALATAKPVSWKRHEFAAAGGTIADAATPPLPQALLVRVREAFAEDAAVKALFADVPVPGGLDAFLAGQGGYTLDPADGCWWTSSGRNDYGGADAFFLPVAMADPFADGDGPRSGITTSYTWDPHHLLPVATIETPRLPDVLVLRTSADVIDYQRMQPLRMTDPGGGVHEVLCDPCGRVIATSRRGTEWRDGAARAVGFTPLPLDAPAAWTTAPDLAALMAAPERYLRGAEAVYFHDADAWTRDGSPLCWAAVTAVAYPDPADPDTAIGIPEQGVHYTDGAGRELQSRIRVDAGPAVLVAGARRTEALAAGPADERWRCSGRIWFNAKGLPYRAWEACFTDTWRWSDHPELARWGVSRTWHYDALGREVRVDLPAGPFDDGFHTLTRRGPWSREDWDADDTLLESRYYQYIQGGGEAPEPEKTALAQAALLARTPKRITLDALAREVMIATPLGTVEPIPPPLEDRRGHDILGRETWMADARLYAAGKVNFRMTLAMTGATLRLDSADAGPRLRLPDVLGAPLLEQDARGTLTVVQSDSHHRPVQRLSQPAGAAAPRVSVRTIHGDSLDAAGAPPVADAAARNLLGQPYRVYDGAGLAEYPALSLLSKPLAASRRLPADIDAEADWSGSAASWTALFAQFDPKLDAEAFVTARVYDANGRVLSDQDAVGNVTRPRYDRAGLLAAIEVTPEGGAATPYVSSVSYDAMGRRLATGYGSAVAPDFVTTLDIYDPATQRLRTIRATRAADGAVLQDLSYWYDAAGNVASVQNLGDTGGLAFFGGQAVSGDLTYEYDGAYRLVRAGGRAMAGLTAATTRGGGYQPFFAGTGPAQAERYRLTYGYDRGDNLTSLSYAAPSSAWSRGLAVAEGSNRAVETEPGIAPPPFDAAFDANGNQRLVPGLAAVTWTDDNRVRRTVLVDRGGDDDAETYLYDSAGTRLLRRTRRVTAGGDDVEIRITLGPLHVYRRYRGATLAEEMHRLEIGDGQRTVAERLWWTTGSPPAGVPNGQQRYRLSDKLGSSQREVDDSGATLSYEEYSPFGATVYAAGRGLAEVSLKAYRYTRHQRDQSTGLYYCDQRYLMPWIGRWASPDPAGPADGPNLYAYVGNNPATFADPTGMVKSIQDKLTSASASALKFGVKALKVQKKITKYRGYMSRSTRAATIAHYQAEIARQQGKLALAQKLQRRYITLSNKLRPLVGGGGGLGLTPGATGFSTQPGLGDIPMAVAQHNPGGPLERLLPHDHPGPLHPKATLVMNKLVTDLVADLQKAHSSPLTPQQISDVRNGAMLTNRWLLQQGGPVTVVATNRTTPGSIGYNASQISLKERTDANTLAPGTYSPTQVVMHTPDVGLSGVSYSPYGWMPGERMANSILGGLLNQAGKQVERILVKEGTGALYYYQ